MLLKCLAVAEATLCIPCAVLAAKGFAFARVPPPDDPDPSRSGYLYAAGLFAGLAVLFAIAARHLHRTRRMNPWVHLAPWAFFLLAFGGLLLVRPA